MTTLREWESVGAVRSARSDGVEEGAAGVIGESLRDELLAVAGVASVEVDTAADAPSGVKVRLLPDADAAAVGLEVQRVLASHGMRSRVASDQAMAALTPTMAPAPVPPRPETPPPTPQPDEAAEAAPAVVVSAPPQVPAAAGETRPVLASLAFEESDSGVVVTAVAADGRRFSRQAAAVSDQAVGEAVVAAVGALSEGKPQRLLWMSAETIEGTEVVAVLVERADGTRLAGAAVVRAAKAYAVARATWAALRG